MKVILRENIENLGKIGDVVKVSEGYARNFLLPRNMVFLADEKNVKALEHHQRALSRKRERSMKDATELSKKLESYSVTINRKVGENDKLFGSVTSSDIAEALNKGGYEVDKRQIQIDEPIKQVGVTMVKVKLAPEVTAQVKVWVLGDKQQ